MGSYASLVLIKFSKFISKNVVSEAPEHKKRASETTFLLINLENFINTKDAYDNFSHKNSTFDQFLIIFMPKIIRTADVVKIADFTFRHVRTNKIYLKMGLNLIFLL